MTLDYSGFLRPAEDGRIWWRLEDAIKLAAGYRPTADDRNPVTALVASSNRVRAIERTLIGAFSDKRDQLFKPEVLDREDGRYVEAAAFLRWLSDYADETSGIAFPTELAKLVTKTDERAATARRTSARPDDTSVPRAQGKFIHFLKAKELLRVRFGASLEEVAMWVWSGKANGGLEGYRDAPLHAQPAVFYFPDFIGGCFDYSKELMHCYFLESDLETFSPTDRYIAYRDLLDRWKAHLSTDDAIALLTAKFATGEVEAFHPITGGVRERFDEDAFPPLEEGIFWLAQVESVENECFLHGDASPASPRETANARGEAECRAWLESLMRQPHPDKPKQVYLKEAQRMFCVSARGFERAWGSAVATTGQAEWSRAGRKSKRRIDTQK